MYTEDIMDRTQYSFHVPNEGLQVGTILHTNTSREYDTVFVGRDRNYRQDVNITYAFMQCSDGKVRKVELTKLEALPCQR
jgi:homospermidine synthase